MSVVTFGEMLMRLTTDPTARLQQTNQFSFYYGGAEANVAVSLANFGVNTSYISRVPLNLIGDTCERYLRGCSVDTSFLLKGGDRLGLYFVESGIGNRPGQVIYDRKFSSFSQIKKENIEWDRILEGVELFHTTGITLALSEELQEITIEGMKRAKEQGIKVSFDFNYRAKLWSQQEASIVIQKALPYVDIAFCNHMDAIYLLNIEPVEEELTHKEKLQYYYDNIRELYPNIELFASTKRDVKSSSVHFLQGYLYREGMLEQTATYTIEPIIDRIGGGDAYAAGILYGILHRWNPIDMVRFATGASVLKHTVKGDGNAFSVPEVEQFIQSINQEINR